MCGNVVINCIFRQIVAKYKKIWHQVYPHSIGLYYSAITNYIGLKPMEDEYITMGMAAYGKAYPTAYESNLKLVHDDPRNRIYRQFTYRYRR